MAHDYHKHITEIGRDGGPGDDDEWPYPDEYVRSTVDGELAVRVRRALLVDDPNEPVTLLTTIISGGYSEYTQEDYFNVRIECAGRSWTNEDQQYNELVALLTWLDETEAALGITPPLPQENP